MKIEVNITKVYLIILIAVVIIAVTIVGVIASHNSIAPNPGHDINSTSNIPTCSAGKVLSHTAAGIICVNSQVNASVLNSCYWTDFVTGQSCMAFCNIGDIVVSGSGEKTGGDSKDDITHFYPILDSPQGWHVGGWGNGRCRAFCCQEN